MKITDSLRSARNPFNFPNLLTMSRIALIPVMAWFLSLDTEHPTLQMDSTFRYSPGRLAAFVVIIAGITDLLDGWFARLWKIDSILGKFLDPVADKLLLMVGLIMLMKLERVPAWLVMILLSREFLITGLRGVAAAEGIVISAGSFGKWKLTFQMFGLGFLMWYGSVFSFSAYDLGIVILYISLVISVLSGLQYLRDFLIALEAKRNEV